MPLKNFLPDDSEPGAAYLRTLNKRCFDEVFHPGMSSRDINCQMLARGLTLIDEDPALKDDPEYREEIAASFAFRFFAMSSSMIEPTARGLSEVVIAQLGRSTWAAIVSASTRDSTVPRPAIKQWLTGGHFDLVSEAIDAGARLEDPVGDHLMFSSLRAPASFLSQLIRAGSDPNAGWSNPAAGRRMGNPSRALPLSFVLTFCGETRIDKAKVLVDGGANPNVGPLVLRPLFDAARRDDETAIDFLISIGAMPGETPEEFKVLSRLVTANLDEPRALAILGKLEALRPVAARESEHAFV